MSKHTQGESGFDFSARYRTADYDGVAWFSLGWEKVWEPYTFMAEDEDGNEYEEDTGEGEWIEDVDGRVVMVMVGDDRKFTYDRADLTVIDEDAFCHSCGQIGSTADGR